MRLAEERTAMLASPAFEAPARVATKVAIPVQSLQHSLAVYDAPLQVRP